jgi:hypothetical protein
LEDVLDEDVDPELVIELKEALLDSHREIQSNDYRGAYRRLIQADSEVEEHEALQEVLTILEASEE